MDKFLKTYLQIIAEEGQQLIVCDDLENAEEARFLLKVGEKFASSPLTKLTSNPNLAGVIHGQAEAESIMKYYKKQGIENLKLIPWEERNNL